MDWLVFVKNLGDARYECHVICETKEAARSSARALRHPGRSVVVTQDPDYGSSGSTHGIGTVVVKD